MLISRGKLLHASTTAPQENVKQVLEDYYFPNISKLGNEVINCKTCTKAKYNRHPKKQKLGIALNFSYGCEMLHIDIYSTDKKLLLTCADKF